MPKAVQQESYGKPLVIDEAMIREVLDLSSQGENVAAIASTTGLLQKQVKWVLRLKSDTKPLARALDGESLADLIKRRLFELERSARSAAYVSHGLVSHFTLSRHAAGQPRKLTHRTAQGIALAIDVPLDQVMAAAGLPMTPGIFELPARAHLLTSKERQAVIAVVDALLDARDALPASTGKRARRVA